tara:strand:- start:320 stop:538 length:219 start_codon:yes stop_codon:yes gene_type:complete
MAGYGTKRAVSAAVRDGKDAGSLERALRDLKRKLKKDGFYKELRRREYFISPSEEKKLKKRRRKSTAGDDLG